ncbi:unnamed protein product, partial [Closterium sp. NIES-53]
GADLQDAWVDQFTPGGQRVTHCTCSRTGRHLATFARRPGSSLYTLTTAPPPVPASGQVAASSQVFAAASRSSPASAPCSCRPLAHETLLWHHRLGHPSLPRLRGMASRALVSGLPSVPISRNHFCSRHNRTLRCIRSASTGATIYAGAMAAQELRRLTYVLTDLGEAPRSPPVLYVDNKAMLALCQEHRTKHIALRYFLARELQQRGQLRLAYVASQANTADVFTKAL